MRKPWSWCGGRAVRRPGAIPHRSGSPLPLALLALAFLAPALRAATVLERTVTIQIQPDGRVSERNHFVVRFDQPADLQAWSPFTVDLDENRSLQELTASATKPDGQVVKIGRRELDTAEVRGEGELHSSRKLRTVDIPAVPVGSIFTIDYQVAVSPYFQAGIESLGPWRDPVEKLRVEVKGGGSGWRWRLDGPRDGLTVAESPGGVSVTASGIKGVEPPDYAPSRTGAVLRYAWGPEAGWDRVGRWYQGLLDQVARGLEAIRQKARELTAGKADPRERLQALATFVQRDVRYVAVEVGIGGYRPGAPADVLNRRWGDCKDKALLLADLLGAVGIEAYPVLIRLDEEGRVDREFPTPDEFNHLIVAVSKAALAGSAPAPDDPASGEFLFIDATQTSGSLTWLHPGVQDQDALVIRGERSHLVHTPLLPAVESRLLRLDLAATAEGKVLGQVHLELDGEQGAAWAARAATDLPSELEHSARRVLASALPGVDLREPHWKGSKEGVPHFEISARVEIPGFMGGEGPARAFQPTLLTGLPAPSLLEERKLPVVLTPGVARSVWRIKVPEGWCPSEPREVAAQNELGSFRQTVSEADGLLTVESRTEVKQRWVEPAQFALLKDLALTEYRAQKRRVRLACPPI